MSRDLANLIAFALTIAAGCIALALGHETIGTAMLTGAIFHAAPSPFGKQRETATTPGLERVENDEDGPR